MEIKIADFNISASHIKVSKDEINSTNVDKATPNFKSISFEMVSKLFDCRNPIEN